MRETWRPVLNGKYEASSLGAIRHSVRKINLKQHMVNSGYLFIGVNVGFKRHKNYLVHRLVAEAFLGPCPKGYQVNHKDGNKLNNVSSNLEYMTPKENTNHAVRAGKLAKTKNNGASNIKAKLSWGEVQAIRVLASEGILTAHLAKIYKVDRTNIRRIVRGEGWNIPDDDSREAVELVGGML